MQPVTMQPMTRRLILLTFVALCGSLPFAAFAQTCAATATNVDFGIIAASPTTQTDTTATITVTCSGTVGKIARVCLGIPAGAGTGSTLADRRMILTTNFVQYQIYKDAARTQIWGLVNNALTPLKLDIPIVTASGNVGTATAYGRVFSGQLKPAGSYLSNFTGTNRGEARRGYVVTATNPDCNTYAGTLSRFPTKALVALGAVCIVNAGDIDFGTVTSLASLINSTGTLLATCTPLTPYTVAMDGGTTTGNIANRRMDRSGPGPGFVGYQLYRDAARTLIWGDGVTGTVQSGTGTGSAQTLTAYGRVPVQTTPGVDDYDDTITVTMTY